MTRRSDFLMGGVAFRDLCACQVMESDLITCHSHTSWRYMAELMTESGFASMLIVDEDQHLLGIVREDDLIMALLSDKDINGILASGIMAAGLPTVAEDTPVHAIMEMMQSRQVHVIPVVTDDKLVGIVTRRDMITAYLSALAEAPKTL